MLVGQGVVLAAVGIVLGSAGALAASRVLRSLVFGVTPTDAATFAAVTATVA